MGERWGVGEIGVMSVRDKGIEEIGKIGDGEGNGGGEMGSHIVEH